MSTKSFLQAKDIEPENPLLSGIRTIIETAFYGNNVERIPNLQTAYQLAKESPGTIVTDLPIMHAEEFKLPQDAKILVFNDGKVVGRTASARRVIGELTIDQKKYEGILREAVYQSRKRAIYHGEVIVGLDNEFSVKSHLLIPEGFENNLYSYLLNFQFATDEIEKVYQNSTVYDEGDLYIFCDPYWTDSEHPDGLVLFDPHHNVAAVLGLRYFGELKKATLTLAWAMANRNGFVACHGGMKQYSLDDRTYTMAVFGLSGSGKSTITLAKHAEDLPVTILHDDAFIISRKKGSTTALEPSYFDKTQDYSSDDPTIAYFLTCQNVGVTTNEMQEKIIITQDIRNGNGRTVKSRFVTPNRVDHLAEPIDAVFWIMKDDSLPPVLRIDDPTLATAFGATLATKRSSAENVTNGDTNHLIIEPFANPFRAYPLGEDYQAFRTLFESGHTKCYVLNTGNYNGKKVTPAITLGSIEKIVRETGKFIPFGMLPRISYLSIEGMEVPFDDRAYRQLLQERLRIRTQYIRSLNAYHSLPKEAAESIEQLIIQLAK